MEKLCKEIVAIQRDIKSLEVKRDVLRVKLMDKMNEERSSWVYSGKLQAAEENIKVVDED